MNQLTVLTNIFLSFSVTSLLNLIPVNIMTQSSSEAGKPLTGAHPDTTKLNATPAQLLALLSKLPTTDFHGRAWQLVQTSFPEADFAQILENALQKNNATGFHDHLFWHVIRTHPEIAKAFNASGCNIRKMQESSPSDQVEAVRVLLQICGSLFREIFGRTYGISPDAIHPDAEVIIRRIDYAFRADSIHLDFERIFQSIFSETQDPQEVGRKLLGKIEDILALKKYSAPTCQSANPEDSQKHEFLIRIRRLCSEILPQALLTISKPVSSVIHELPQDLLVEDVQGGTGDSVRKTAAIPPPLPAPPAPPVQASLLPSPVPESIERAGDGDGDKVPFVEEFAAEFFDDDRAPRDGVCRPYHDGAFDVFSEDSSSSPRGIDRVLRRVPLLKRLARSSPRLPGFSQTSQVSRSSIPDADFGDFDSLLAIAPTDIATLGSPSDDKPHTQSRIYLDVSGGLVSPSAQGFVLSSIDQHSPSSTRTGMAVSKPNNFFILGQESSELQESLLGKVLRKIGDFIESSTTDHVYFYLLAIKLRSLYRQHFPGFRFVFLEKYPYNEGECIFSLSGNDVEALFFRFDPVSGQYKPYNPTFDVLPEMNGGNGGTMAGMKEILKFKPQKGDLAVMVSGTMARFLGSQKTALDDILNPPKDQNRKMPVARQLQLRLQTWLLNEKADSESLQRNSGGALIVQL